MFLTYKEDSKDLVFGSCEVGVKREGHSLKCPSLLQFSPRPFDVKRPGIVFRSFSKEKLPFLPPKGKNCFVVFF